MEQHQRIDWTAIVLALIVTNIWLTSKLLTLPRVAVAVERPAPRDGEQPRGGEHDTDATIFTRRARTG